ncbi:shikimate kinase [Gorillibacterium sp. CAU 1737]|uniref:shikimate kinase n=1 Tax=Gorillibacterium sp. CAU 1737 TaxID=3140362 RepID=UPI0032617FB4
MNEINLILVGFMGTGKSTIGRLAADRLGYAYRDSDQEVERATGMTIPEIFAEKGEDFFRDKETAVLHKLLRNNRQVISTGGGSVLREENRRLMLEHGVVAELIASKETIIRRVSKDRNRPLLAGDVRERVAALLTQRAGAYAFAHHHLETDGYAPEDVVELLLSRLPIGQSSGGETDRP